MFEQNVSLYYSGHMQVANPANQAAQNQLIARRVFNRAVQKSLLADLAGRWFKNSHNMLDLSQLLSSCRVLGQHSGGVQTVDIVQVVGSEGRSEGFDAHFRPQGERTRDRWISVAFARLQGLSLPLVDLIQVVGASGESRYFVRDGHHRISVARAFGQQAIEANVTVLRLSGRLPWEKAPRLQAGYAPAT